jgi:hypothetical protein
MRSGLAVLGTGFAGHFGRNYAFDPSQAISLWTAFSTHVVAGRK